MKERHVCLGKPRESLYKCWRSAGVIADADCFAYFSSESAVQNRQIGAALMARVCSTFHHQIGVSPNAIIGSENYATWRRVENTASVPHPDFTCES